MVCQVTSYSRPLDSENTPPTSTLGKSSKACICARAASRRRRDRAFGGVRHPRYAIEHANHSQRASKCPPTSVKVAIETHNTESVLTSTTSISLPRYLSRPEFREVSGETLRAVAPELADTHGDYLRDKLECFGPQMQQVLAGVRAQPITNALPKELSVVINDLSSDMPTHMLAVYARQPSSSSAVRRRVTLFPTHSIVLAAHCANLPSLPPYAPTSVPDAPGSSISIPVVPLCIPSPDTFSRLSNFLYTKRVDHLLASLLPCPPPASLCSPSLNSSEAAQSFSAKLAATYTAQALLSHAMTVHGLWRNACALGVSDERLWGAMDVAWEVLLGSLAVATAKA
ncbi:hypothetical protein BV22DRAFT_1003883 [Leucogyrophana mollusca]|uniref:Uncharacterized protein n=1 Tax=Leucogyrophana mollusca TaxID=85980 RepID=A0ACB8BTN9_9AGAM|nr:hypothetical protein BV22DRAFT_1003883 [Leucogyrophana mollusca]